jgi:hypothetical protein
MNNNRSFYLSCGICDITTMKDNYKSLPATCKVHITEKGFRRCCLVHNSDGIVFLYDKLLGQSHPDFFEEMFDLCCKLSFYDGVVLLHPHATIQIKHLVSVRSVEGFLGKAYRYLLDNFQDWKTTEALDTAPMEKVELIKSLVDNGFPVSQAAFTKVFHCGYDYFRYNLEYNDAVFDFVLRNSMKDCKILKDMLNLGFKPTQSQMEQLAVSGGVHRDVVEIAQLTTT